MGKDLNREQVLSKVQIDSLSELIRALGKATSAASGALATGYDKSAPWVDGGSTNRGELHAALGEVRAAMVELCEAGDLSKDTIHVSARWHTEQRMRRLRRTNKEK